MFEAITFQDLMNRILTTLTSASRDLIPYSERERLRIDFGKLPETNYSSRGQQAIGDSLTNYLEGVVADIIAYHNYTLSNLKKECPDGDTEDDFALFLLQKHFREIQSWRAPIEISRGPEGRYLEDQPREVQAVEVYLEFMRALSDP